jgi:hypothetical protein
LRGAARADLDSPGRQEKIILQVLTGSGFPIVIALTQAIAGATITSIFFVLFFFARKKMAPDPDFPRSDGF